jgi:hypothetical protein
VKYLPFKKVRQNIFDLKLAKTKGNRFGIFSLSIYFAEINKNNLRVSAINGLLGSISIILLGGIIGTLVDRYQRLTGMAS